MSNDNLTVFVELKLLAADTDLLMTAERSASDEGLERSDIVPLCASSAFDLPAETSRSVCGGTALSSTSDGSRESSVVSSASERSPPLRRLTMSSGMIWEKSSSNKKWRSRVLGLCVSSVTRG